VDAAPNPQPREFWSHGSRRSGITCAAHHSCPISPARLFFRSTIVELQNFLYSFRAQSGGLYDIHYLRTIQALRAKQFTELKWSSFIHFH